MAIRTGTKKIQIWTRQPSNIASRFDCIWFFTFKHTDDCALPLNLQRIGLTLWLLQPKTLIVLSRKYTNNSENLMECRVVRLMFDFQFEWIRYKNSCVIQLLFEPSHLPRFLPYSMLNSTQSLCAIPYHYLKPCCVIHNSQGSSLSSVVSRITIVPGYIERKHTSCFL